MTLTALARWCDVLCENPFTKTFAKAQTMLQAARGAGVIHLVGFDFLFTPERVMMARAITSGAIGEPKLASFTSFNPYRVGTTLPRPINAATSLRQQ